jgi:two-component system, LytTR family, response regulator AlgR
MKVLLVDDEPLARERLARMLAGLGDCELAGEAGDGRAAVELARRTLPDVVLLDIRMPGMDGLEAARHLAGFEEPPAVVFCTAYGDHAVQAFDVQAVDYLVKPVRRERLAAALARARQLNRAQLAAIRSAAVPRRTHISARTHRGVELIPVEEIRYFRADRKYVTVRHAAGEILVEETLRGLEQEFAGPFVRVHRAALAAVRHIERLERDPAGGLRIRLRDIDEALEVSRRHAPALRRRLRSP